ncbi:MAG: Wzz/FepE/Etk N-terminal domain-containing protein, partial [Prevotellaceae bacterium]|nr:Wzz/FepE/Etk N-terminal domain-containing protein [Prevotellaceae bacterium]
MDIQDTAKLQGKATKQSEEFLSLRDILDIFLDNWKWFLVSVIAFVALAILYLATQPDVFRRDAVMLVKDDGSRSSRINFEALSQMGGGLGSGVENEVYILQSHQLISDVVKDMKLDVLYYCKDGLKTISLYKQKPFEVTFTGERTIPSVFRVRVLSDKECEVYKLRTEDFEDDWKQTVAFGDTVESPAGSFVITPILVNLEDFIGSSVKVFHLDLETATNELAKHISTAPVSEMSTLVAITYTDIDIQRADDILSCLLNAYKRSIIVDKNTVAQSTAEFIDERIKLIGQELSDIETSMANFKQANNIVSLSENASAYLTESTEAHQRTLGLQNQRDVMRGVYNMVKNNAENDSLIPTLGVGSDEIQDLISGYNSLLIRRNHLVENSGKGAPTVKDINFSLEQRRNILVSSMENYLATLEMRIEQAVREEAKLNGSIQSVPQQEREARDIARQQSIKSSLYTYLLNKREETTLQLAVTEANVRIVERPFGNSSKPIAPRKLLITAIAFLLGLLVPFAFFWIKNLLNMGVRGRRDIETYTTIPIIGEIPHAKEKAVTDIDIIRQQRGGSLAEAFRMANFSLSFMHKDAKVIMFTSTIPGEGKTFAARC